MHANLLAQSDHVSGAELRAKGIVAVTIAGVAIEEMEQIDPGKKGKRPKGVISFREPGAKPWIINKTNVEILKLVFGGDRCGTAPGKADDHKDGKCCQTDHWIGHKIALGATDQKVGGEKTDGIIVVGCDALKSPMDVEIRLRSKSPRTFTVKPPGRPAAEPAP